jgi:hypothetical protein
MKILNVCPKMGTFREDLLSFFVLRCFAPFSLAGLFTIKWLTAPGEFTQIMHMTGLKALAVSLGMNHTRKGIMAQHSN